MFPSERILMYNHSVKTYISTYQNDAHNLSSILDEPNNDETPVILPSKLWNVNNQFEMQHDVNSLHLQNSIDNVANCIFPCIVMPLLNIVPILYVSFVYISIHV